MKADNVSKTELAQLDTKISSELTELRVTLQQYDQQRSKRKPSSQNLTPTRGQNRLSLMSLPAGIEIGSPEQCHTPSYRDITLGQRKPCATLTRTVHAPTSGNPIAAPLRPASTAAMNKVVNEKDIIPSTVDQNDFITVTKKKSNNKRRNLRGALLNCTRILVSDPKVTIYLSRTKKSTTIEDIKDHIKEMNETCQEVELLKQNKEVDFNSFKISVSASQLPIFLNTEFWPSGLLFRRYRERTTNGTTHANANKHTLNG